MIVATLPQQNKRDFDRMTQPHELSLEEKDELLFALLEHLKLGVYRAHFDNTLTMLAKD